MSKTLAKELRDNFLSVIKNDILNKKCEIIKEIEPKRRVGVLIAIDTSKSRSIFKLIDDDYNYLIVDDNIYIFVRK